MSKRWPCVLVSFRSDYVGRFDVTTENTKFCTENTEPLPGDVSFENEQTVALRLVQPRYPLQVLAIAVGFTLLSGLLVSGYI